MDDSDVTDEPASQPDLDLEGVVWPEPELPAPIPGFATLPDGTYVSIHHLPGL